MKQLLEKDQPNSPSETLPKEFQLMPEIERRLSLLEKYVGPDDDLVVEDMSKPKKAIPSYNDAFNMV